MGAYGFDYLPPESELRLIATQREWKMGESDFLGKLIPIVNDVNTHVAWEVLSRSQGRATVVDYGAPLRGVPSQALTAYIQKTLIWGGSDKVGEEELLQLQTYRVGSPGYKQAITRLFARKVLNLDERLEKALAYARVQGLKGKLALDENGVKRTIVYGMTYDVDTPLAAGTDWSDLANAYPLTDLETIFRTFIGTGAKASIVLMNSKTMGYIARNTKEVAEMFKQSQFAGQISVSRMPEILKIQWPSVTFLIWDGVIDGTGLIADDTFIVIAEGGEKIGEFVSTVTTRAGSLENPSAGKFSRIITHEDVDPPHVEIIHGMAGLPVIYHPEWVVNCSC